MSGDKRLKSKNPDAQKNKEQRLVQKLKDQLAASTETLRIMQAIAAKQSAEAAQTPQNNNQSTNATQALLLSSPKNNDDKKKTEAQVPTQNDSNTNTKKY